MLGGDDGQEETMKLPVISSCDESDCYYNREKGCHAPAITVGDLHPRCDTFAKTVGHIARQQGGLVGACHVSDCRHNSQLICGAKAIRVGRHDDHPDCLTFESKT
jgi:hypothetical protein